MTPEYQPGFESADTSVAGCVPFYGVYDLAGLTGDKAAIDLRDYFLGPRVFKKDPRTHLDDFVKASPLAHVSPDAPDFFVLHGANDSLVHVGQARAFVDALKAGVEGDRDLRRVPRHPARLRGVRLDPQPPRDQGGRALAAAPPRALGRRRARADAS